jgi:hypothetical protein
MSQNYRQNDTLKGVIPTEAEGRVEGSIENSTAQRPQPINQLSIIINQ